MTHIEPAVLVCEKVTIRIAAVVDGESIEARIRAEFGFNRSPLSSAGLIGRLPVESIRLTGSLRVYAYRLKSSSLASPADIAQPGIRKSRNVRAMIQRRPLEEFRQQTTTP